MSLIGKTIIKKVAKSLTKTYGGSVIDKLEDLTKNTEKKLDKKINEYKNDSNYNSNSYKDNKRIKRVFIFLLILFLFVAFLLSFSNNKEDNQKEEDANSIIKTTPVPTDEILPTMNPGLTPTPMTTPMPTEEIKLTITPTPSIIKKEKYKVKFHIDYLENIILNKYDITLKIGNISKILVHGKITDFELTLEAGDYDIVFSSNESSNVKYKEKISISRNLYFEYQISSHTSEIKIESFSQKVIDQDGNIDEDATIRYNFIYDVAFYKSNPYDGFYSHEYLLFDLNSNKAMHIYTTTSARYGKKKVNYSGRYIYSGNLEKEIVLENEDIKDKYLREGDYLVQYDEEGKVIEKYHLTTLDDAINELKEYTSYFKS